MASKLALARVESRVDDGLARCVHCGLCLSQCPTYRLLGTETESPRGRLHLIRAALAGQIAPSNTSLARHITRCLQCRACESACPSGVPFGRLIAFARSEIRPLRRSIFSRLISRLIFAHLVPHPSRLRLIASALTLYQRSGLQWLARRSQLLGLLKLAEAEALLPSLGGRSFHPPRRALLPEGVAVARAALFSGCVGSLVFGEVQEATIRVLIRAGFQADVPSEQACCGALHVHSGEIEGARELARRNIGAFEKSTAEFVVANAAGCGAMLKEYGELLAGDPKYATRAARFSEKVRDFSELLVEHKQALRFGSLPRKVTYQDPCHLAHVQKVRQQPRELLRAIPDLELLELTDADLCCGSAGIYNLTQPGLSGQLLERKIAAIAVTGADTVITANPGCHLHLEHGFRKAGLRIQVVHLVQVVDAALCAADATPKRHAGGGSWQP